MLGKVLGVVAGLALGAAVTTAGVANASALPAAAPHWHIVKPVKTGLTGDFTAVVATGKTTGWAFDGYAASSGPAAWERDGSTWAKVAFPGKSNEYVACAGATSPSDVWAFTANIFGTGSRVLRWNGHKWSVVKAFTDDRRGLGPCRRRRLGVRPDVSHRAAHQAGGVALQRPHMVAGE